MKKLLLLLRVGFPSLGGAAARTMKKNGRGSSPWATVLVVVAMLYLSGTYSFLLASSLEPLGALHLVPMLMMAASSIITLITSVSQAPTLLFLFKDYDLLSAMPISRRMLLGSRFIIFYLYNLAFSVMFLLPPVAIYAVMARPGWVYYPLAVITALLSPMLPSALGALLGVGVKRITARFHRNNLINTIAMVLFFFAVMALSMGLNSAVDQDALASAATLLAAKIGSLYPPVLLYGQSLTDGNALALLEFMALNLLPLVLAWLLFSRYFGSLRQSMSARLSAVKYSYEKGRRTGVMRALYRKELRRLFSSPNYTVNGCVGLLMMVLAGIAAVVMGRERLAILLGPDTLGLISVLLPFILCYFVSMTSISACSVSLEGKSLSLLKALPLRPGQILLAKALVSLSLTVTASLLSGALLWIALGASPESGFFLMALPAVSGVMISFAGVLINLAMPRLDWTNEIQVVKQSTPVLLVILIAFVVVGAPLIAAFALNAPLNVVSCTTLAVLALVSLAEYRLLFTWGEKRWMAL